MKNRELNPDEIAQLRLNYPPGSRIELIHMEDNWAVPEGTCGTVEIVDDAGQIHMKWDNGRTLAIVPQVDKFRRLTHQELQIEQGSMLMEHMTTEMT